jgi:hypothetical protein
MAGSHLTASDFDVITGPASLPSRLPSPAGGPLPTEAISGKSALTAAPELQNPRRTQSTFGIRAFKAASFP